MYLWKYWRESRIVFYAALLGVLILLILGFKDLTVGETSSINGHVVASRDFSEMLTMVLIVVPYVQAIPLSFLGWLLGSCGVGRGLGERSGPYIFSRPRSRAYFVWCDWCLGLAMLLCISVLLNAGMWLQIHWAAYTRHALYSEINLPGGPVPIHAVVIATWAAAFLLSALIFSVTYFSTVVVKHSRGIILGAGLLVGYTVLSAIVKHYWPGIELPHLLMQEYKERFHGLADHLWISATVRAGILLLFPIAAQLILERVDI
jgi:hypothetical protein